MDSTDLRERALAHAAATVQGTPDEIVAAAEKYFRFIAASELSSQSTGCSSESPTAP